MNAIRPTTARVPPAPVAPIPADYRAANLLSALRAAAWKELRSNVPYALAIVGLLSLVALLPWAVDAIYYPNHVHEHYHTNLLATEGYRLFAPPVSAVIGLLLGIMARMPRESSQWALLVHRPIGRGWMFAGRMIGGLANYGIAVGLPAAVAILYAAASWGIPFHWRMTLPTVADVACGFVYYLAGMLAADRRVFFIWRVLPVMVAGVCSALVTYAPWFWLAMLVNLLFAVTLGTAALGAFWSDGYALRAPLPSRVALKLVLAVALIVMSIPVGIALKHEPADFARDQIGKATYLQLQRTVYKSYTTYQFLPDGTVGRQRHFYPTANGEQRASQYLPFASETPLTPQPTIAQMEEIGRHSAFVGFRQEQVSYRVLGMPTSGYPNLTISPQDFPRSETGPAPSGNLENEIWYNIPEAGVFRGYGEQSHRYVGSIGASGFAPPGESPEPFASRMPDQIGPKGLYAVNPARRAAVLTTPLPPGTKVNAVVQLNSSTLQDGRWLAVWWRAVATPDRILLYATQRGDTVDQLAATLMLSGPKSRLMQVVVFPTPEGGVSRWGICYGSAIETEPIDPQKNAYIFGIRNPTAFDLFDANGRLISHETIATPVVLDPPQEPDLPAVVSIWRTYQGICGVADAATCLPAAMVYDAFAMPPANYPNRSERYLNFDGSSYQTDRSERTNPGYIFGAGMTLLVCAGAAWWMGCRYRARFVPLWVLVTVLLGPLGMVLLAMTHTLPRREPCGKCGRWRFAAEESCRHCGAEFSVPPHDPAAIFA